MPKAQASRKVNIRFGDALGLAVNTSFEIRGWTARQIARDEREILARVRFGCSETGTREKKRARYAFRKYSEYHQEARRETNR